MKKLIAILLTLALIASLAVFVPGCQGEQGLQGPAGPQGPQGIQGVQGPAGAQGEQGEPGEDGILINWLGTSTKKPSNPSLNDAYYNPAKGASYVWDGNSWEILARDGHDGATGPRGYTGATGATGPAGAQGEPGAAGFTGYGFTITRAFEYSDGGWAGWSAPAGKVVLGGGFYATAAVAVSAPGTPGSVWPHYTYGPDEYGWVVRDAPDGASNTIIIYVIYADAPTP